MGIEKVYFSTIYERWCKNCFNRFFFSKRGFNVKSYGSGTHVKLPGSAADKPNIYTFDTPYQQMYDELLKKDYALYPE